MKVYRIIDNSSKVLVTTDRLKALEKIYELAQKYEDKQTWFWSEEDTI